MSFFDRFGTDRHKYKIEFFLKKLSSNVVFNGKVYVSIKRGDHKVVSKKEANFGTGGVCDFGKEILTFQALTLFYDSENKAYQKKQGIIKLTLITPDDKKKSLGQFQFDVAEYANQRKQNISVRKQINVSQKVKSIFEFDVFIKALGDASQTSKSIDKKIDRKKQPSPFEKFTNLFTGTKQSPKKKQQDESQQSTKKIAPKANTQKPSKNKYDLQKKEKADEKIVKNSTKRDKQKGGSEEDEDEKTPPKPKKNIVETRQKDNFTEIQQSEQNSKPRKNLTPQQPFYFDEPTKPKKQAIAETVAQQKKPKIMKRMQNINNISQQEPKNEVKNSKMALDQLKKQQQRQNAQYERTIKQLQDKNKQLEKQNKQLQNQSKKLSAEKDSLETRIEQLESSISNNRSQDIYQTERQGTYRKVDDEKVRNLEKEKGDLLVRIQKLEQKYKKDYQKYQETVEQLQEQKSELEEMSKAEIKRLKEQYSELKDKHDRVQSKYEEKTAESKQFKQRQNDLREQLAIVQNSLSQLKLKIGDKLNEANEEGNKSVIDILTLLYDD